MTFFRCSSKCPIGTCPGRCTLAHDHDHDEPHTHGPPWNRHDWYPEYRLPMPQEVCGLAFDHGRLQAEAEDLRLKASFAQAEAERLRHGVPVEGDYVCPNSLALTNLEGKTNKLRYALGLARHMLGDDCGGVDCKDTDCEFHYGLSQIDDALKETL